MNIKITKEYEGKVVYGIPTGNNARRGITRQEPVEFLVIKRKTKYVELQRVGWGSTDNYDPSFGRTQSAINSGYVNNSGYRFYANLEDIEKDYELQAKRDKIINYFRSYPRLTGFNEIELDTILNILFKEDK